MDESLRYQQNQPFCAKCLNNQRMYMETVSNYLPDEYHPQYREFEDALPQFKADLEKRYPQVCKKCAPNAQERLFKADYYGMSQQAAKVMSRTQKRRGASPAGERDDWGKWSMRLLLSLLGMVMYASLSYQVVWHAYGILVTISTSAGTDDFETNIFAFDPTLQECKEQSLLMRFSTPCYEMFGAIISKALLTSFCLLWYNHGLKDWYHNTYRIEFVHGQTEHFRIQLLLLIARAFAWYNLSNPSFTEQLTTQQLLAAHGLTVFLMLIAQRLGERQIRSEKWRIKGKIMPRPSEQDVFGATAGPADENYNRQASSVPPVRLFQRDGRPFPIGNLAPKPYNTRGYSKLDLSTMPPSPPDSQSVSDEGDEMDIDWQPHQTNTSGLKVVRTAGMPGVPVDRTFKPKDYTPKGPQTRSMYNHGTTQPSGWGAMRHEIFGIQDHTRVEDERKRIEEEEQAKFRYQPQVNQSPFRGRLPPAPMSMERRLRNPPTQVQFKKTPLSKQQDFMRQMRDGIGAGKAFRKDEGEQEKVKFPDPRSFVDDEDFSPVKTRTRGTLELRNGGWNLPGDGQQETGLEDLFAGKTFRIADEPAIKHGGIQRGSSSWSWHRMLMMGVPSALIAIGWNVQPVRRAVCLWMVERLEGLGH